MDPLEGVKSFTPPYYIDPLLITTVNFGTVVITHSIMKPYKDRREPLSISSSNYSTSVYEANRSYYAYV